MPVGMRIRNSGNILQIDGTYQNHELLSSGSLVLNQDDISGRGWYSTISIPVGQSPLVAFRAAAGCYWNLMNASTIQVFAGSKSPTPAPTIQYWLFGSPLEVSNFGQVGLVIRSEASQKVVFNSNRKYLRVLQPVVGDIQPDTSWSASFPGKTVALIQGMRPESTQVQTGGTGQQPIFVVAQRGGCMTTPDASTAIINNRAVAAFTGIGSAQPSYQSQPASNYLVVDVTGY